MSLVRIHALSVVALVAATGCFVPQTRYDDAVTRLEAEKRAHATAEADLGQAKADLARLDATLKGREDVLASRESELAQAKLDTDRVTTERDDAIVLVEQIRGELARAGEHLREFSDQKHDLEEALAAADQKLAEMDAARLLAEAGPAREGSLGPTETAKGGPAAPGATTPKPVAAAPKPDIASAAPEASPTSP